MQSWNKILWCANRNERLGCAGGIVQGEPVLARQLIGRRTQHLIPIRVVRAAIGALTDDDVRPVGAEHLHRSIVDPRAGRCDATPDRDGIVPQQLPGDVDRHLRGRLAGIANRDKGLGYAGGIAQREPVLGGQLIDG